MQTQTVEEIVAKSMDDYKARHLRIGFSDYPESKDKSDIADEIIFKTKCRGYDVQFGVRLTKLTFGENEQFKITGVVTDRVEISHRMIMGGFGQHGYVDEAASMREGIIAMCKKHNLRIVQTVVDWAEARVMVEPVVIKVESKVLSDNYSTKDWDENTKRAKARIGRNGR